MKELSTNNNIEKGHPIEKKKKNELRLWFLSVNNLQNDRDNGKLSDIFNYASES